MDADCPADPAFRDPLLPEVEAFLTASCMSATAFGRAVTKDPALVHEMRLGRELRHAMRVKIQGFMAQAKPSQPAPRSVPALQASAA